jgi:pimeloyl-ACP methyl ester carboxylesterase
VVGGVTWWEIDPLERQTDLVSVHLHGLGASPASVLRSVDAALAAGMGAAVPDLRVRRSTLGAGESEAIRHWLLERPAGTRFVLVGWSMGAEVARHLLTGPAGTHVQAVLLISPVLDWSATIGHSARNSLVPSWWMRLVLLSLRGAVVPRLLGMTQAAMPLHAAGRGDFPPGSLAIHSVGDRVTPHATTVRSHDAGAFALHSTVPAPHTLEWNVSTETAVIAQRWFVDQARSSRLSGQ